MNKRVTNSWFVQKLIEMGACKEAIRYARKHRTFLAAWNSCKERDWMMWLGGRLGYSFSHTRYCPTCDGVTESEVTNRIHRRFPADRVSKALRKWKA